MSLPSESLRAVKRGRDGWRQIQTGNRMSQFALRELASSILHHYPYDYHLNEYWSEYVCEHGEDREFCRECKVIETAPLADKCVGSCPKQHKDCTTGEQVQLKDCIRILTEIRDDPKTTKWRREEITLALLNVKAYMVQDGERSEETINEEEV